jgi:hypothetical protein
MRLKRIVRTDLDRRHSAENRKVGGSIPSLPTTFAAEPWRPPVYEC